MYILNDIEWTFKQPFGQMTFARQNMRNYFDVIVIGAGGSGLAAACSAAEFGGRVLVLEKRPQPGGTTGIAVGSFTAAGTIWQRKTGIDDNPLAHDEDAGKFARPEIEARNNHQLRQWFLHHSAETLEWLAGFGLSFVGPFPEPPNRVPRMHNVVPGAKAYVATLQLAVQQAGGTLLCGAEVQDLLQDGGRVVGVRVNVQGESREFHAACGVILAAGDYASSADLIARHKGERFRQIEGINPFASGDGHRLAARVGARLENMDITYGPELRFVTRSKKPFRQWLPVWGFLTKWIGRLTRWAPKRIMQAAIKRLLVTWQHPEDSLFTDGAILLNQHGQRFVNENAWPDREIAVASQSDKVAWILLDNRLTQHFSAWPHFISTAPEIAYAYVDDYRRLRPDVTHSAASLELAAERAGLPTVEVRKTVECFNRYISGKVPDEFGRTGDTHPIQNGPCVLLGPVKAYFTTTEGGATVNERLQVIENRGCVIPGLYAVGQNGLSGMVLWGHGLHIAWAMTSGRLAGRFVMEDSKH